MEILVSESAITDLEDIIECYKEQDIPNIGSEIVSVIIEYFQVLLRHPEIDRKVPEFNNPDMTEPR